jgi:hypothetical protein
MAATASVHHQEVDGVAAHVEHTQSHTFNLTGLGVNFVSRPRCGVPIEVLTGRRAVHDHRDRLVFAAVAT